MEKRIQTRHRLGKTYAGIAFTAFLVALVALPGGKSKAEPVVALNQGLEEAILVQDWEKVISLLPKELEPNLPASLQLVKGHACLATNRNNESLCLFLNASSEADLKQWQDWCERFLEKHPTSLIAYYFLGDSYARLKQWSQAVETLDNALVIDPNHAQSLNARAVIFAHQGMPERARADIEKVLIITGGQLADAWANLGYYWIQKQEGAVGAIKAFSKAIELSPNFALAFHGRGCAQLVMGKKEAKDDFNDAMKYGGCADQAMRENYTRYVVAFSSKATGIDPHTLLANLQEPGTTFDKRFNNLSGFQNKFEHNFRMADTIQQQAAQGQWDLIPFGRRIADGIANRFRNAGMENVRNIYNHFGSDALKETFNRPQFQDFMPSVREQAVKIKEWNPKVETVMTPIVGQGIGALGKGNWQVGLPFTAGGAFSSSSAKKWNQDIVNIMNVIPSISPRTSNIGPGGVSIDFAEVRWDDGDWPFVALYALAYRSDVNTPSEVGREEGAK